MQDLTPRASQRSTIDPRNDDGLAAARGCMWGVATTLLALIAGFVYGYVR